jgi:hypothetical protein
LTNLLFCEKNRRFFYGQKEANASGGVKFTVEKVCDVIVLTVFFAAPPGFGFERDPACERPFSF